MAKLILALLGAIAISLLLYGVADGKIVNIPQQKEKYLWEFILSRYYSPVVGQKKYYTNRRADLVMNCGGDEKSCEIPADGLKLQEHEVGVAYSCPPEVPLGSKIKLQFHWWTVYGVCRDRGGAIKDKRLDARCGYWEKWVYNIKKWKWCFTGKAKVYIL